MTQDQLKVCVLLTSAASSPIMPSSAPHHKPTRPLAAHSTTETLQMLDHLSPELSLFENLAIFVLMTPSHKKP